MSNKMRQFEENTLYACALGKPYKIAGCRLEEEVKNRLYEMGLTPRTTVTVTQRAPLGDPLQITLRGYCLCIRGSIAKLFDVEELL